MLGKLGLFLRRVLLVLFIIIELGVIIILRNYHSNPIYGVPMLMIYLCLGIFVIYLLLNWILKALD